MTCSKWSVGHGLGASGLVDLSLACEILKHQQAPAIATLKESDLEISEWLLKENYSGPIESVLISSLGFGGMCSAMEISKGVS